MKKTIAFLCAALMAVTCLTGCLGIGEKEEESVNVQSVAMICGVENQGLLDRFAGIVSSRGESSVDADTDKSIKEFLVAEGDEVQAGDVLFTYDVELAALELEKAELELQQMNVNLEAKIQAKATLEKEKEKAKEAEQLSYSLEIQQIEAEIREMNYNITLKEKDIAHLREAMMVTEAYAPIDGRVTEVNEDPNSYDMNGNKKSTVTIVEAGSYRVKGYVNELNAGSLLEGTLVTIRSRVDDRTWGGYISMIDWANPKSDNNYNYYYYVESDEMTSTTEYPFYVELDDSEGLLLGQHVYIEPAVEEATEERLCMGAYYMFDIDGNTAFVWAEKDGKLEKRKISVSDYDEMMDCWYIDEGLTANDYIAMPVEGLKEGQPCIEYDESIFNPGEEDGNLPAYDGDGYYEEDVMDVMPETAAPAPINVGGDKIIAY